MLKKEETKLITYFILSEASCIKMIGFFYLTLIFNLLLS